MSALAPYPSYRDEDRQTFSRIPGHWNVVRARHLVRIRTGSGDTVDAQPDGTFPFYVRSDKPLLSDKWEFDTTAVLTAGDGAGVAKVFHLVSGRFMAHQRVYVLDDFRCVTPEFFYYALSNLFHLMALDGSAKSTVDSVRRPMIADMPFAVPSPEEQRAITNYLDRETARIDTLIEEQQCLIEMLRERRTAVADRALSRGLDAELEHTGDPWLPVLPIGWKAVPTRRLLSFGPSNGVSPEVGEVADLRTLSLGSVRDGRVSMGPNVTKFVDRAAVPRSDDFRLRDGDILLVRGNGNVNLVGRAGLVGPEFDAEEYIYPDLLIRLRVGASMIPAFFVRAFNSAATRAQIETRARTAVGTYKVAAGDVRAIVLPTPPLSEQRRIVAYLDEQTEKIDALIAESERFVELSRERRSALITAAVTGQIDVREMA